jgi:hypothetical protein
MKYKTKQVEIEAIEWTGENMDEILAFTGKEEQTNREKVLTNDLFIRTLEGQMHASKGDFIIKGLKGEFYPCKPDIFHLKYEEIIN